MAVKAAVQMAAWRETPASLFEMLFIVLTFLSASLNHFPVCTEPRATCTQCPAHLSRQCFSPFRAHVATHFNPAAVRADIDQRAGSHPYTNLHKSTGKFDAFAAACAVAYTLGASAEEAMALLKERMLMARDVTDAVKQTVNKLFE